MTDDFAQWLAANPLPSIDELIEQYGSYGAIPGTVWAQHDAAMRAWQLRRRDRYGGAVTELPKRAARIRRQSR
jgi:hypothetical protein